MRVAFVSVGDVVMICVACWESNGVVVAAGERVEQIVEGQKSVVAKNRRGLDYTSVCSCFAVNGMNYQYHFFLFLFLFLSIVTEMSWYTM